MVSKLKILQQHSDDMKKREFFAVSAEGMRAPQKLAELESAWQQLYKSINLPFSTFRERNEFGKEEIVINFNSGLQIVDDGHRVSFRAQDEKSDIDKPTTLTAIGMAANLLYRQGGFWEPTTNREGSGDMIQKFKTSYNEAKAIVDRETIAKLRERTL